MSGKFLKGLFSDIEAVPPILQSSYYSSLDGLRGVAIIMVVLSHLNLPPAIYPLIFFNGHMGVLIFFVISGFLITTLCLKEKVLTKDISLKNFYIRRALRIFPVAYLYILVITILNLVFKLSIPYMSILGAALYLMNFTSYFRKYYYSWHTGHYWSLSVEEQFYLIVPFILKKNFRLYLLLILFIIFILPIFMCLQSIFPALNVNVLYAFTHFLVKFQSIAIGCLFSVLMFKYPVDKDILTKNKVILNVLAIILILAIQYNDFLTLQSMFSGIAVSFLTGYIIVSNIVPAKDFLFKLLNSKALKIVGVLSYSIYIWQEVFTSNDKKLPYFMITFPYNVLCIISVSCLSYYFYERFFLKLKTKFSKIKKTSQQTPLVEVQ